MQEIQFIDTSLRDGNQSLWDATGITTGDVLAIAPQVNKVGFRAVDFISNSGMDTAVRYHRENPWERVRLAVQAMPDTPLSFGTTSRRFIGFKRTPDSILALVIKRMKANGIRRVWILDAAHEVSSLLKVAHMCKAVGIEETVIALSFSLSPVHTDEFFGRLTGELTHDPDVNTVYIKDQGGLLTPERIKTLVPAVQAHLNGKTLEIHSHCNTGLAPLVYLEAIRMGVHIVHTGVPPVANGTAQPSIYNILNNIKYMGYTAKINAEALAAMASYLEEVAAKTGKPRGVPFEYDISIYEHQLPGGMVSTMKRQLKEGKMEDRLPEVMEEIIRVRKELGWPIMVTPLSQMVGSQATMNVMSGERYKVISSGVMEYVAGYFGPSPVPIDPTILDKITSVPKVKKMMAEEFPQPSIAELRRQIGAGADMDDEEFLLRYAMRAEDVNAMLARGPFKAAG
ncbi:MAG: biotin carboxyl carrier protein [Deltaproteobacteria bacterium]|nr:biotin carboxyl carrier protein [Deltaproteobacteria bacterium]